MNAIQPYRPPSEPEKPRRVPRQKKHSRSARASTHSPSTHSPSTKASSQGVVRPHRLLALEASVKLTVNVVLAAVAVTSLVRLLPYHWSQQAKLQEIGTEFKLTEGRVNRLQTNFNRYFDPNQATSVMQEQSHRLQPGQQQVIWVDNDAKEVEESE